MAKIKGIWIFNEFVSFNGGQWYAANFTCDGISYIAMSDKAKETSSRHDLCIKYHKADGTFTLAQDGDSEWVDAKYRTVDFGETEQEVVDAFLTWMQANATYQVTNPTFQIQYKENNVDIELGKITTLHVSNKKLTGDIVVVAPVVEQYEVWDGSCTINTATSLISFTIDGDHYEAEEGMTWGDWRGSEYNTGGWSNITPTDGSGHEIGRPYSGSQSEFVTYNEVYVLTTDVIIADAAYGIKIVSDGGGGVN